MPNDNQIMNEMRRRLEHLRSIPETPLRRREMLSLERALVEAAKQPTSSARTPSVQSDRTPARRKKNTYELPEVEEIEQPRRKVVRADGHRKVILTAPRRADEQSDTETEAEKRSREHWKHSIKSMFGGTHRGMS